MRKQQLMGEATIITVMSETLAPLLPSIKLHSIERGRDLHYVAALLIRKATTLCLSQEDVVSAERDPKTSKFIHSFLNIHLLLWRADALFAQNYEPTDAKAAGHTVANMKEGVQYVQEFLDPYLEDIEGAPLDDIDNDIELRMNKMRGNLHTKLVPSTTITLPFTAGYVQWKLIIKASRVLHKPKDGSSVSDGGLPKLKR